MRSQLEYNKTQIKVKKILKNIKKNDAKTFIKINNYIQLRFTMNIKKYSEQHSRSTIYQRISSI